MAGIDLGYTLRGTAMQLVVFLIIPIVWWAIKGRKAASFKDCFGLYLPAQADAKKAAMMIGLYCAFWIVSHLPAITRFTQPSANQFLSKGAAAILPALIVGFVQTAFCEEMLFRGFLLKRLKAIMNEHAAIILQAALFGAVHNLFELSAPFVTHLVIFVPAFVGGLLLGYINEKAFDGSILPSIALHGVGNSVINLSRAFGLFMA